MLTRTACTNLQGSPHLPNYCTHPPLLLPSPFPHILLFAKAQRRKPVRATDQQTKDSVRPDMDDYTREMMDLKTLVTRTLEKKGVLAKIRVKNPTLPFHFFSFQFFLGFLATSLISSEILCLLLRSSSSLFSICTELVS